MIKTPDNPKNYCVVCNEVARRTDLSARAKGIYYYIATLPPSWELQQQEAEKHFTEGREAFKTAFKELIEKGYISQIKAKDEKGRLAGWKYNVLWSSEIPEMQETDTPENRNRKNRQTENRHPENPQLLNTDIIITDLTNTEKVIMPTSKDVSKRFTKPTIEEIRIVFSDRGFPEIEADKFYYHHDSKDWMLGKNKMKSVSSAISKWLLGKTPAECSLPINLTTINNIEEYVISLIKSNPLIRPDNFNKEASKIEIEKYFNFVKSKGIENWKSAIKTMFDKNVDKFIYS